MTTRHRSPQGLFSADFGITCVLMLLTFTAAHLVLPIAPLYVLYLGGNETDLGWVSASFSAGMLISRFIAGKWSERIGPARVMWVSAAMALASAFAYNFAWLIAILVVARFVHGLGVGAFSTASNSLVAYMASPTRRAQALGLLLLFVSVGMGIGPAVGMAVVNAFNFQILFVVVTAVTLVPPLTLRLVRGLGRFGPDKPSPGKFISRSAALPAFVGITGYFSYGAFASYLPVYALQKGLDNPGLFFAAYATLAMLVRLCCGGFIDRRSRGSIIIPGLALMSLSTFCLTIAPEPWTIVVLGAVYGLGTGAVFPTLMALAVDKAGPRERSSAVATFLASTDLGLILGAVVSGFVVAYLPLYAIWLVAGAVALLALLVFAVLGRGAQPANSPGKSFPSIPQIS